MFLNPTAQVHTQFLSYSSCFKLVSIYHTKGSRRHIVFIKFIGTCFTSLLKSCHNDMWQILRLDKLDHIWNMWLIFLHPKCWISSSYEKKCQLNSTTLFSNVKNYGVFSLIILRKWSTSSTAEPWLGHLLDHKRQAALGGGWVYVCDKVTINGIIGWYSCWKIIFWCIQVTLLWPDT